MTDVEPELAAGQAITELLAGFIQELRQAGLPVSLTENLDAMEAVKHIPLEDREAFKYALAATLVKNNTHWRAFETVFEVYFSLRGSQFRMGEGDEDALAQLLEELEQQEQMEGDGPRTGGGGGENMTPEEIAEMLYKALQRGRRRADARGRPPVGAPLRRHGAGPARRRHLLPLPHAAEPRSRRRARPAHGAGPAGLARAAHARSRSASSRTSTRPASIS